MEQTTTRQMWGAETVAEGIIAFASAGGPRVLVLEADAAGACAALTESGKSVVEASLADVAAERFDVIVVPALGSIADPSATLAALGRGSALADDGFIVLAAGNASHHAVVRALAADTWPAAPGALQAGGARLYTRDSLHLLCESEGLTITALRRVITSADRPKAAQTSRARSSKAGVARQLNQLAAAYVARVRPSDAAAVNGALRATLLHERVAHASVVRELAATRRELDALTEQRDSLLDHYGQARSELERLTDEAQGLRLRFASVLEALGRVRGELASLSDSPAPSHADLDALPPDEAITTIVEQLEFELAKLRGALQSTGVDDDRIEALEDALSEARGSLQAIYRSETWKLARLLLAIPAAVRRRLR